VPSKNRSYLAFNDRGWHVRIAWSVIICIACVLFYRTWNATNHLSISKSFYSQTRQTENPPPENSGIRMAAVLAHLRAGVSVLDDRRVKSTVLYESDDVHVIQAHRLSLKIQIYC